MVRTKPRRGVILRPDDHLLAAHPELYGATRAERLLALAEAITTSPLWGDLRRRLRIAIRSEPTPLLAAIGDPQPSDEFALRALGWQVADSLQRLRPVTYREAEAACAVLADRLRDHVGTAALARSRFVPLPRGGLIVAGMVAYCLGLDHEQLQADTSLDGPTVIVDDCMLSGTQLRRWIRRNRPTGPVIAAHLHSHPELRDAVETQEPAIDRCIAAVELTDYAPSRDGYNDWVTRWRQRTPESYWIGNPDHVCYPWNEPEALIWNTASKRAQPGWRVVPPSFCMKNRADSQPDDITVCAAPRGSIRPADDVVWAQLDKHLLVVDADSGSSVRLDGVGGAMWRALTTTGILDMAVDAMAAQYDVSETQLRRDIHDFHLALRERSLLA